MTQVVRYTRAEVEGLIGRYQARIAELEAERDELAAFLNRPTGA